jgi:hypothetical protein
MIRIDCPWCDEAIALEDGYTETHARCDACSTIVELADAASTSGANIVVPRAA